MEPPPLAPAGGAPGLRSTWYVVFMLLFLSSGPADRSAVSSAATGGPRSLFREGTSIFTGGPRPFLEGTSVSFAVLKGNQEEDPPLWETPTTDTHHQAFPIVHRKEHVFASVGHDVWSTLRKTTGLVSPCCRKSETAWISGDLSPSKCLDQLDPSRPSGPAKK